MPTALKTRLLGAAVLIALAVIVVPLFFSGKPSGGGNQSISLDIPPPPDEELQTRTLSVAPPANANATNTAPPPPNDQLATVNIPSRVPPEVNPVSTASAQAADDDTGPTTAAPTAGNGDGSQASPPLVAPPEPEPAEQAAPTDHPGRAADDRYRINLGAYAKKQNAQALVAKVATLGYQAHVSGADINGEPAAHVYVGPFDSRAGAEAARLTLRDALPRAPAKLESVASDQHANAPAKALPDDQAGGWAVQVVAYSKRSDANDLRDRLRKAGFDSYVDDVRSGGQTLWRVRVGPMTQRDDAVAAINDIKGGFPHLNGVVVAVP